MSLKPQMSLNLYTNLSKSESLTSLIFRYMDYICSSRHVFTFYELDKYPGLLGYPLIFQHYGRSEGDTRRNGIQR